MDYSLMSYVKPLGNGKHPTNRELRLMRLGYGEYQTRLQSIREHKPARYTAIMEQAKTFHDELWRCHRCSGQERYTRNMACADCARARASAVFKYTRINGDEELSVYTPEDEARSLEYQQRIERSQYRKFYLRKLSELGEIQCGYWTLNRGVLVNVSTKERIPFLSPSTAQQAAIKHDAQIEAIRSHVHSILGELPD